MGYFKKWRERVVDTPLQTMSYDITHMFALAFCSVALAKRVQHEF